MDEDTDWFGDIDEDDDHLRIEEWETYDGLLAERGMTEEERRQLWRSLNPNTPVYDWHADLMAQGLTAAEAQQYIKDISEVLS